LRVSIVVMMKLIVLTTYISITLITTGCLKLSEDTPNSKTTKNKPKEIKLIRNLLSYKTVSLERETEKYKNISDATIKSLDGVNSVFITKESLYKNPIVKFNSTTDAVEIALRLDDGSTLNIQKR